MYDFSNIVDTEVTLKKMKRKRGRAKWNRHDPDVIPVDIACPDYPVPHEIEDAAIQAIKDGCWGYAWFPETFEAIAETVRTKYEMEATLDDIKITPSTEPTLAIPALIACKPGDEIIIQSTMYTTFIDVIDYVRAKPTYLAIKQKDNWKFDIDLLNELVTKRTKVIYLCNPNNPLGRVMTKKELEGIADIVVDNNLLVGVDEIYSDIVFDGRKHISIASLGPNIADRTITMMGLSKTFGLAGLKIGWLVATNKEIMDECKKVTQRLLKSNYLGTKEPVRGTSTISLTVAHAVLTKCNEYISPLVEYIQEVSLRKELMSSGQTLGPMG
jgi:aspartate/methionine/tyrosine aminotransferase